MYRIYCINYRLLFQEGLIFLCVTLRPLKTINREIPHNLRQQEKIHFKQRGAF